MAYWRPKLTRAVCGRDDKIGTTSRQMSPINKVVEVVIISQLEKGTEMLPPLAELYLS